MVRFREISNLSEARREEITYTEKQVKGVIDRVTIELTSQNASAFSRISDQYYKITKTIDELTVIQKSLRGKIKSKINDLFDATDIIYTRIVETAKLTATMSKQTNSSSTYFDKDGYVAELESMIPELDKKLKQLKDKYTIVKTIQKSPGLRIKLKDSIEEDFNLNIFFDKLKIFTASIKKQVWNWANGYDQKLENLRSLLPVSEALGGQNIGFGRKGRNAGSMKQDLVTHIKMTQSGLGMPMEEIRAGAKELSNKSIGELKSILKELRNKLDGSKLGEEFQENKGDKSQLLPADMKKIGAKAFHNGLKLIPVQDPKLMAALENMAPGTGANDYLKAWISGWNQENLKN